MKIVTSGRKFLDIDAYAGCVAYAELLNLQGIKAVAYSTAVINESVPNIIRSWGSFVSDSYSARPEDTYILIDVSEPDFIEKTAIIDRVEEVIDHHVGFEEYWQKRIGEKADIEFIGAACTQVYERWQRSGSLDKMNKVSARLLIAGILDNTLNFKASVTRPRDQTAYVELLKLADLPEDWAAIYFKECEAAILEDLSGAITNDTKVMTFKNLGTSEVAFGQLVIWNATEIIEKYQTTLSDTMIQLSDSWFVNIVSISEGKSYFMATSPQVIEWSEQLLGVEFDESIAVADRLWLRKEIVKESLR